MADISKELKVFLADTGNKNLVIPPYQRNYTWEPKNLIDLWTDIVNLIDDGTQKHFIGLIVLVQQPDSVEIVDGQQRLTSIFLLLAAIRDSVLELYKGKESAVAFDYAFEYKFINDILIDEVTKKTILTPNRNDGIIFKELIKDYLSDHDLSRKFIDNEEVGLMDRFIEDILRNTYDMRSVRHNKHWKAYKFFYTQLQGLIKGSCDDKERLNALKKIRKVILEQLRVIDFKSSDQDAFNLFETLNERGLGLEAVDLIKNHFLRKYENTTEIESKADGWDEIFSPISKLSNSEQNAFLRHLFNSRYKFINKSNMFKGYKQIINELTTDSELDEFLKYLKLNSDNFRIFRQLFDSDMRPLETDVELFELLLLLQKSGSVQWYSVAFSLFNIYKRPEVSSEEIILIKKVFWLLANMVIRFQILEVRFNILEKKLPKLAMSLTKRLKIDLDNDERDYDLSECENFDNYRSALEFVINELKNIIVKDVNDNQLAAKRTLDENLLEIVKDSTNSISNIFKEHQILSTNISKDYESNSIAYSLVRIYNLTFLESNTQFKPFLSLEHVLPIKHQKNWSGSSSYADRAKYQLGNMIMLSKELNSTLSNSDFKTKLGIYKEQNVEDNMGDLSVLSVKDQEGWSEELIFKRTAIITNKVYAVLKELDFNSFLKFRELEN